MLPEQAAPSVPKVLVDLSVAPSGGAATYADGFARGLIESVDGARDRVVVLFDRAWLNGRPEVGAALQAAGVEVVAASFPAAGTWRARLLRGRVVARVVRDSGVDVAFFPRDAAPRLRVPTAVLLNNRYAWASFASGQAIGGRIPALLLRVAARLSARRAAVVLAVSQAMADEARGARVDGVVHHGCSLPEHPRPAVPAPVGGEAEPVQVLMVGNLIENKRVEVVLAGVAEARARGGAWDLRIHGTRMDPVYADRMEALSQLLLGESVLHEPVGREALVATYQRADVLVVGGAFESFCHPLVEGMRSGCVVVAPDVALVREICGDVAVTYPEGDAAGLARALETAVAERAERSRRGIERSRRFTWEQTAGQTVAAVRSVAAPPVRD